ncbi:MAG: lectin-like protein, partial [Flavobacteriaceae bacterium]|nr:lectin-like protein [Flavobacteriaceae bacterium]
NGIDDQLYESNDEAFTVAVESVSNVSSAVSSFDNVVTKVISDDSAPTIKLSASDDVVDENGGTVNLVVSLADAFSSTKSDMNASSKADFYYLGEYNGSKYYSSKNEDKGRISYSDALSLATTLGGQLAVVTSAGENDFITNKIYEKDPEYNTDNNEWLNHWIGHSYDSTNTVWKWTNDAQSDYTNWGWDYNPDYIDRYHTQIRYRGLWFNGENNWHSQFVLEFSSAISDINATAVIEFGGTGATDGTDYTTNIGAPDADRTVTIAKGQPSATIIITGVDDSVDEAIETIITTMKTPGEAVIAVDSSSNPINNSATLSISDDELPAVTLAVASTTIGEVASEGVTTNTTITANIDNAKLNAVDIALDFTSSGAGIAIFGNDFGSNDLNRVTTHAGDGNDGYLDGDADEAEFSDGMKNGVVDASGNVYIADEWNNVIRKITPSGKVSTYAGTGWYWGDGDQENTDGDKLNRTLTYPNDVKINGGYMYVVESNAHAISRINMSTGVLSRYVGKRTDQGDDNGNETEARFNRPSAIAFDSNNVMYVVDKDNNKIRKVVDDGTNRIVSDFAGSGNWGERDGDALEAELSNMRGGIVVDSNNNIYVTAQDRIRKISADGSTVSTIAGEWHDYADGYGTNAKFRDPSGLAIDENDNIYVGDANNHRIRKVSDLSNASGAKVETISGTGDYDYGDGTQDEATYREPRFVAYGAGALFVIDVDDNRIRKVQLQPKMTIPAGQNSVTYNLKSINDVVYETDETIRFTSNTITGGTLANSSAIDLTLKSDELIPKIELDAESLVLNEADGTLELEVHLTDAAGATAFWENTELPSEASNDFEFMGEFEGHKYYFSRYSSQWDDANQNALDVGGQLLVIDSQSENEFINTIMIHNGTWLGTTRKQGEASWSNVYGTLEYENFEDNIFENEYGYALTYGNKWYRD